MSRIQSMFGKRALGLILSALALVAASLTVYSQGTPSADSSEIPEGISIPPNRDFLLPGGDPLPRNATLPEAATVAWVQFLALSTKSTYDTDGRRGIPAPGYPLGASGETLLWQTWAHRVELRPNQPLTTPWDQLGRPDYQAIHAYSENIVQGESGARWDLLNNLDEDNEIGSCNLYGQYRRQSFPKDLVLYQVKVNRDEYEYIRTNYGADQQYPLPQDLDQNGNARPGARVGKLYRAQTQVKNNIKNAPHAYYPGAPQNPQAPCQCPTEQAICLPCGGYGPTSAQYPDGAIEVKSAWRRLLPSEDASRYYTTTAIYYEKDERTNTYKYYNGTFALIGIHIIRKTASYPDFIFTTFEHVGVKSSNFEYYQLDNDGHQTGSAVPVMRQRGQGNRRQNHPIPGDIASVNQRYRSFLSSIPSVWQYYQLTGVQTNSVDCLVNPIPTTNVADNCRLNQNPETCANLDPNYFMANFVIESDPFLNNFSGPGFGGNPFGDCRNTVYNNQKWNNGGCKGCHGVAQTAFGTDFSFLLDFGNNKPAIEPDTIHDRKHFSGFKGPLFETYLAYSPHIPGGDFHYFTPSLEACRALCGNCTGFMYYHNSIKTCVIQPYSTLTVLPVSGAPVVAYARDGVNLVNGEAVSAAVLPRVELGDHVMPGVELSGDHLTTVEVPASAADKTNYCRSLCAERDGCAAYSDCTSESGSRTCHLKGSRPEEGKSNPACNSGILSQARF